MLGNCLIFENYCHTVAGIKFRWWYICSIISEKWFNWQKDMYHFLPLLISRTAILIKSYLTVLVRLVWLQWHCSTVFFSRSNNACNDCLRKSRMIIKWTLCRGSRGKLFYCHFLNSISPKWTDRIFSEHNPRCRWWTWECFSSSAAFLL